MTIGTFPTAHDYQKLRDGSDKYVLGIWRALQELERMWHCCYRCGEMAERSGPIDEDWMQSVLTEIEVRYLPVKLPEEPVACETCQGGLECISHPDGGPNVYFVCRACGMMRQAGDHMDHRWGPAEPLPEGW